MMKTELDAGDGVLPLIERPFATEHKFVEFVIVDAVGRVREECFSIAVGIDLRHGNIEVLGTETTQEVGQFSTETFAEENVKIALRSGIEDHQEFTEFVEMLKESIVIGDLDVSIGIVGEECRKGNGRHNAQQISGDDDHQHVCHIVAFLFVRVDATMSSFAMRQRVD